MKILEWFKVKCMVGLHNWSVIHKKEYDKPHLTDAEFKELTRVPHTVGRFNKYRFCADCKRIEIDETRTNDGIFFYSQWTHVKSDRLRYEGFNVLGMGNVSRRTY